jgi:hypothetical protein
MPENFNQPSFFFKKKRIEKIFCNERNKPQIFASAMSL